MNFDSATEYLFFLFGALFAAVFSLSPFLFLLLTAFSAHPDFLKPGTELVLTAQHFREVLLGADTHFLRFLWNSIVVSSVSATASVALASLAAYGITRIPFPGRRLFMMTILAVSLFPPISLVSYLFHLFSRLGWTNTYAALILPYVAWNIPLALWVLVSYFSRIPLELDRAAQMDGCSRVETLVRIILPVASPGIVSTFLLAFIFSFNEFLFAILFTTDYRARTIPVGIALFEGLHGEIPWSEIMAAAAISTLPVVLLALFFQRRMIQGLTGGAVKG